MLWDRLTIVLSNVVGDDGKVDFVALSQAADALEVLTGRTPSVECAATLVRFLERALKSSAQQFPVEESHYDILLGIAKLVQARDMDVGLRPMHQVFAFQAIAEAQSATTAFEAGGEDMVARTLADVGGAARKLLLQKDATVHDRLRSLDDGYLDQFQAVKTVVQTCRDVLSAVATHDCGSAEAHLVKVIESCQPLCLGGANGESWRDDLPDDMQRYFVFKFSTTDEPVLRVRLASATDLTGLVRASAPAATEITQVIPLD